MVPGHTMVSGVAERGLRGPGQVSSHEQLKSPRAISLASPLSLHQTLVKTLQTLCAKEDSGPAGVKMS